MIDASRVRAEYLEKNLSEDIEKKIIKAAQKGYPALEVDYLSDTLIEKLEAAGYKVEFEPGNIFKFDSWTIYW